MSEFEGGMEGVEREVRVGRRFDVGEVVKAEAEKVDGGRLGVVVCGPAGMCDEVRDSVVQVLGNGVKVELCVEAFCW